MDNETLMGIARLLIQVGGVLVTVVLAFIAALSGVFLFFDRLQKGRLDDVKQANEKAHDGIVKNIEKVETRLAGDIKEVRGDVKEILKRLPG